MSEAKKSKNPSNILPESERNNIVRDHLGSLFTFITLLSGSLLYFCGATYIDQLSQLLGLGIGFGDLALQETMMQGASLILEKALQALPILAPTLVLFAIIVKFADWASSQEKFERFKKKHENRVDLIKQDLNHLRNRTEESAQILGMNSSTPKPLVWETRKIKFRVFLFTCFWLIGNYRLRVGLFIRESLGAAVGLFVFFGLFLCIMLGHFAAVSDLNEVRMKVDGSCSECKTFTSGKISAFGIAVLESQSKLVVMTKEGTTVIPLDAGLAITDLGQQSRAGQNGAARLPVSSTRSGKSMDTGAHPAPS